MRVHHLAGLCLALLLAACSSTPAAEDTGHIAASTPAAATGPAGSEAAQAYQDALDVDCQAAGGTLQPLGRLQRVQCVIPYADAGKACSTGSDCSGQCLASGEVVPGSKATGTCQRDISENFGCRQRIDGGVAQGTLCVD
ncbi:hypothetical protein [Stenotrophomonas sp. 24(2023)]|uniref:hypothetical protein n=1 Tax=Stenotrophomonas sp. 24(2023) TaxID=3068324 RepID=UPI0027DEEC54|nr:hypothetical protein [Stenotrophomonas sp. 24(2023)]WMJ71068.1 hypothetical protein Q9R17_08250 [Stenotrophomonas sp. 24(2023)]